jgi:farnesyl-diphosphate farnesyltransferase
MDLAYQEAILPRVSRTFALTIPQLPEDLRTVVANAYLLCRIADTIEDSDSLNVEEKERLSAQFVDIVSDAAPAQRFAQDLSALLGDPAGQAENDLVRNTARVVRLTHSFAPSQRAAVERCVRIMSAGMGEFQRGRYVHGLRDQPHLDRYCYHVAGVVGEMLTELFCFHSRRVAKKREALAKLAVSFGQGLQMTNILKDIWEDKQRNMCWLPQGVFTSVGFDLSNLSRAHGDAAFQVGLARLIAVALAHLRNAVDYALLIPHSERGLRNFCLWAIGMAVLTLRKINRNRGFTSGAQVKITRRMVAAATLVTRALCFSNTLLRIAFGCAMIGLPCASVEAEHPSA